MTFDISSGARRTLVLKISIALSSFVFAIGLLFLVEGVLQLSHGSLENISLDDLNFGNVYSTELGWEPKPNYSYMMAGVLHSTNGLGYRGTEYPFERTPGKTRVVLTGDSITFGYGTRDQYIFSQVLDDQNEDLEVINLGVQGYGTDQALIRLERDGLSFHPDIVIHGFCIANDLLDNLAAVNIYDETYPKPYFDFENDQLVKHDEHLRLSVFRRLTFFLANRSFLFNYLTNLLNVDELELRQHIITPGRFAPKYANWNINHMQRVQDRISTEPDYAAHLSSELLLRMARLASEHGARFAVMIFPPLDELDEDKAEGDSRAIGASNDLNGNLTPSQDPRVTYITSFLEQHGIEVINMRDELIARGHSGNLKRLARDSTFHLRRWGHRVTAEILSELVHESHV